MKSQDFKEFLNLRLVDIADRYFGTGISFIFETKTKKLKGFTIYPKNIDKCFIEEFKVKP